MMKERGRRFSAQELAALPEDHETRTDHFLHGTVAPGDETDARKYRRYEPINRSERVPMADLRGGQTWVDTHRVYGIARFGHEDTYNHTQAPVTGTRMHDGTVMLNDGHHRAAAAAMRGAQFLDVHIQGAYGRRYDGLT